MTPKNNGYFTIDLKSPVPRYYQIQQNITELIEANLLRAGDSLPSERELSELYAVNRMTLRQAIMTATARPTLQFSVRPKEPGISRTVPTGRSRYINLDRRAISLRLAILTATATRI